MDPEKLRESLDRLRSEIEHVDASDTDSKAKLSALIDDLERQLEEPDEEFPARMAREVRAAIEHFELEHPRTIAALNRLMAALGGAGL